jgi:hypothetical protein
MAQQQLSEAEIAALLAEDDEEPDLTPAQIIDAIGLDAAVKRFGGTIQPPARPPSSGMLDSALRAARDLRTGVAGSVLDTALGAKDLVGLGTEQDRTIQDLIKADVSEAGGWGTAGGVLGDIAQMAAPGGAALRLAKAAKLAKAATPLGASMIVGAGGAAPIAAIRSPDEGDTRAGNAAQEAAIAAAGGYLGGKLISGIEKTPAAQAILNAGGYLTPGMAAKSKMVEGIEAIMEVSPFLAQGTKKARGDAARSWNRLSLNEARPPRARKITEGGSKGVAKLRDGFTRAYDNAWAKAKGEGDRVPVIEHLQNRINEFEGATAAKLKRLTQDIEFADSPKRVDRAIRTRIKEAVDDPELQGLLQESRAIFRDTLGPKVRTELAKIDKKYPLYLTVRKAAAQASADYGYYTPQQLVTASRVVGGETPAAIGTGPLLTGAQQGVHTVGKSVGGQPLEWFRRVAGALPTTLPLKSTGRVALGQTAPQRVAQGLFQSRPISSGIAVGGLPPALFEE